MKLRMLKITWACVILLAVSAAASPTVFVSNPYTTGNSQTADGSFSDDGVLRAQGFTDVDYNGSYKITDFHWWGTELGSSASDLNGFLLKVYSNDVNDMPGTEVYSEFFGASNVTIDDGPDFFDAKYGVNLTTPFSGSAGKYWFSVTADFTSVPWFWGWTVSQTTRLGLDDKHYYLDNSNNWQWATPEPGDLTFEVSGENIVPEPASLTLFGIGLFGGLAAIRRRKK
jgi:hypothetical protein